MENKVDFLLEGLSEDILTFKLVDKADGSNLSVGFFNLELLLHDKLSKSGMVGIKSSSDMSEDLLDILGVESNWKLIHHPKVFLHFPFLQVLGYSVVCPTLLFLQFRYPHLQQLILSNLEGWYPFPYVLQLRKYYQRQHGTGEIRGEFVD